MESNTSAMPSKEFLANDSDLPRPSNRKRRSERTVVQEVNTRNTINEDEESDSEMFRVKRRSSNKVERKIARDFAFADVHQQVLYDAKF